MDASKNLAAKVSSFKHSVQKVAPHGLFINKNTLGNILIAKTFYIQAARDLISEWPDEVNY